MNDMDAATEKMCDQVYQVYDPSTIQHTLYKFTTLKYRYTPSEEQEQGFSEDVKKKGELAFESVVVPRVHTDYHHEEKAYNVVRYSDLIDRLQLYFGPHFKVKYTTYKKSWNSVTDLCEERKEEYEKMFVLHEGIVYLEFYPRPSQNMRDHIDRLAERYREFDIHDPCIMGGYVY